ncbi:hypothetical protein [Elizabethkingia anophelis]|uniref:hypothetical protein n=1 Tax=Elizabethkingia anophelis TaxID=1117645 RepID=UPI003891AD6B
MPVPYKVKVGDAEVTALLGGVLKHKMNQITTIIDALATSYNVSVVNAQIGNT